MTACSTVMLRLLRRTSGWGARGFQKIGQGATDAANFQRTSFTTARAGLVAGRSRPTISMTPAIPASGLRISWPGRWPTRQAWPGVPRERFGCDAGVRSPRALAQLLHHVIEVAAEVADFVVALGEADRDVQVALAHLLNFFLQFDHGPLNQVARTNMETAQNCDRSAPARISTACGQGRAKIRSLK